MPTRMKSYAIYEPSTGYVTGSWSSLPGLFQALGKTQQQLIAYYRRVDDHIEMAPLELKYIKIDNLHSLQLVEITRKHCSFDWNKSNVCRFIPFDSEEGLYLRLKHYRNS